MTPDEAVRQFISDNFEPGCVAVFDFTLFPYGKRLVDRKGDEMVVYWDWLTESVKVAFPNKKGV